MSNVRALTIRVACAVSADADDQTPCCGLGAALGALAELVPISGGAMSGPSGVISSFCKPEEFAGGWLLLASE